MSKPIKKLSHFVRRNGTKSSNKDTPIHIYDHPDLTGVVEILKNKFYFATLQPGRKEPRSAPNLYLFNIDQEFVYKNFYNDFGPLNIACLYKYCRGMNEILSNPEHELEQIVHFTSTDVEKRTNAVYLVASYSVLYLNKSPIQALKLVTNKNLPQLKPFQDASFGASFYTIQLSDCLNALSKTAALGFFNFADFDVKEYEKYEQINHGDLSWIVPQKFLAFLGPSTEYGSTSLYPEKYLNYFMKNEVTAVIRLNKKNYESFRFTNAGILHYDMFFPDGTIPPKDILKRFMQLAETTKGAIAVHCKAGLGRTGSLIAAYMIKHYRMTAREAIAWLRICRPGSVIGQQQAWLEQMEHSLWREGSHYRLKYHGDEDLILHHKKGIYSLVGKFDREARLREFLNRDPPNRPGSVSVNSRNHKRRNLTSQTRVRCSLAAHNIGQNVASSLDFCTLRSFTSHNSLASHKMVTAATKKETITQGDKLNEIKMNRSNR